MSETSTSAGSVNPESPWLGLRSFSEETRGYFFGRDAELDDLYERVIHRPLTIFFGQSGLGKTSLLRAGLIPRLRETGFVPVILRVGWNAADEEPEQQVKAALRSALRSASVAPWQALAEFPDHLSLWHLLHDPTYGLLAAPEALPPPRLIFVFDQFEEIFTLGQKQRARADAWAETLAALVENRPPTALRAALQRDPSRLALLDLRAAPAKFLLSLRHDYLHLLERWRRQMPSLYDNRFELKMLTGPKAFQAVVFPGRLRAGAQPLVDEATAEAIVRFVAGAPLDKPLAAVDAVPPLLSLVCAELNRERVDNQAPAIVFDPLLGQPPEIRQFLLKVPLDADGKPEPVSRAAAERDLLAAGLSPEQIAQSLNSLWDSRLLTITGEATSQVIHLSANLAKVAARSGTDILQAFYNGCFAGLHGGVRPKL